MRIPLTFTERFKQIMLPCLISIPHARIMLRPIEFLIDTGSNITFLDESDLQRLSISPKLLSPSDKQPHLSIGGGTFGLHKINDVRLFLKTQENTAFTVDLPKIEVSLGVRKGDSLKGVGMSIIGMDFITENKFILFCDTERSEYYLEKRES